MPELFPPVAYSRLPTRMFTKGKDTGLSFQVRNKKKKGVLSAASVGARSMCC